MFVLFIGVVLFAPLSIISAYLAGINKYVYNLVVSLIGVVVCILLDIFLIPRYGIMGACMAFAGSYLVISVLLIYYFSKIGQVSLKELFYFDKDFIVSTRGKIGSIINQLKGSPGL